MAVNPGRRRPPWALPPREPPRYEYGVFEWRPDGRYYRPQAVMIFKSEKRAQRAADRLVELGGNYVVRPLVPEPGQSPQGNPHMGRSNAYTKGRGMSVNPVGRRAALYSMAAALGLSVDTYSPGDGVTRYRFFPFPGGDYFAHSHQAIATVKGLKRAFKFLEKYRRGVNPPMLVIGNPGGWSNSVVPNPSYVLRGKYLYDDRKFEYEFPFEGKISSPAGRRAYREAMEKLHRESYKGIYGVDLVIKPDYPTPNPRGVNPPLGPSGANPTITVPGGIGGKPPRRQFHAEGSALIRSKGERRGVPVAIEGWEYGRPLGTMVGTHAIAYDLQPPYPPPGYYRGHGIWGGPSDPKARAQVRSRPNPLTAEEAAEVSEESASRQSLAGKYLQAGMPGHAAFHAGVSQGMSEVGATYALDAVQSGQLEAQSDRAYELAGRALSQLRKTNPLRGQPRGIPPWMWSDPAFQAELRAYRKRHGRGPVEIRRIKVPKGFPRYMSVYGTADHAVYDAPPHSTKGKRIHHFGRRGRNKPWLVSSVQAGPKFLAYVGGSFKAKPDWIYD